MRRITAICGGLAALLHFSAQPAQAQSAPDWSGFYAGLHAGYARGRSNFDASDLATAGFTSPVSIQGLSANGAAFGFTGGFNAQSGLLVLGVEGDWARTVLRTDVPFAATIPPFGAVTGSLGSDIDWMASLRLRAGLAVQRALVYGTAGLAMGRAKGELTIHGVGAPFGWTDRALLAGWTFGAGVEYALSPSWSVKGEFIRTQLGDGLFSSATDKVPVSSRTDIHNLRGGLNFRF
jgi:outer membrane immunogenic protein